MALLSVDFPNGRASDFATALGFVTQLLYATSRREFPISAISRWLVPPIRLGQFSLVFDASSNPVGYATWAYLSDEVSKMMEVDAIALMHLSEWNEGLNLWIVDFVALPGFARSLARHLRGEALRHAKEARALKRGSDESLIRIRTFKLCGPSGSH